MGWRRAFSTLGCAELPLSAVVRRATAGGWQGIELRSAPDSAVHVGLSKSERADIRGMLRDAELTPLAIASYVEIDDPQATDETVVADLLRHVQLASDIGAPYVRVFPGGPSHDGASLRRLASVGRALDDHPGVTVALESHDSCSRGRDIRVLLDAVGHPQIGAIWDIQHPWRAGEAVQETLESLRPYLAYIQITDARGLDDPTPALLGRGVLPLREVYDVLRADNYDGWISLEWASYWYPQAAPFDAALRTAALWFTGALWESRHLPGPGPL
jgi:sugar phosphate isomerase/epimerase